MANLTDIYKSRRTIGLDRQPTHSAILDHLHDILTSVLAEQPYKFMTSPTEREAIGRFKSVATYKDGSVGLPTKVSDSDFIYRLSGIKKIAASKEVVWRAHVSAGAPPQELFRLIEEDYKRVGTWINLSRYCAGYICNDRNLSWWTSFQIDSGPINDSAHRLGLANNWLDPYSVILRFPVASLKADNSVRVPTAIDAYCSPVFHNTRDADKPKSGVTVNLTESMLAEGEPEYVLKIAQVDEIEILPVFISDKVAPYWDSNTDAALWERLHQYYQTF